jgi:hypothetical protein
MYGSAPFDLDGGGSFILKISEGRTERPGMDTAPRADAAVQARVTIRLIEGPDRARDVLEFAVDRIANAGEPSNQAQHAQRGDEDQFGTDDEPAFVADKLLENFDHGVCVSVVETKDRDASAGAGMDRSGLSQA